MPGSITIVSPVSGETIKASAVMSVSVDYDYVYGSSAYIGAACTAPLLHSGQQGPISGPSTAGAEVGLGTHSGSYTGVEVQARILSASGWDSGYYCQASVNNITISNAPPIQIAAPAIATPTLPYFKVAHPGAKYDKQNDLWALEFGVPYKAKTDSPKMDREYDPNNDLTLNGTLVDPYASNGSLLIVVSGKLDKTGLIELYTVPKADITINAAAKTWTATIPKKVLKKKNAPRLVVVTLLDKDEEAVSITSAPLKKA